MIFLSLCVFDRVDATAVRSSRRGAFVFILFLSVFEWFECVVVLYIVWWWVLVCVWLMLSVCCLCMMCCCWSCSCDDCFDLCLLWVWVLKMMVLRFECCMVIVVVLSCMWLLNVCVNIVVMIGLRMWCNCCLRVIFYWRRRRRGRCSLSVCEVKLGMNCVICFCIIYCSGWKMCESVRRRDVDEVGSAAVDENARASR